MTQLARRVIRLERASAWFAPAGMAPEQRARAVSILKRLLDDPVRHAQRLAVLMRLVRHTPAEAAHVGN